MAGAHRSNLADVSAAARLCGSVLAQVERAVVGKRPALELVLAGLLAGGHVMITDNPGLGKTLAARSFARALGLPFKRVQFTPDLLPADITGSFVYNQRSAAFEFREGPLFAGMVLADEINRTPPKTQAALLEAMQERQVTVEGTTFPLPSPFHVISTANPIEYEGTYPLPEAQLDRFLLRVSFGYPSGEEEVGILRSRIERRNEAFDLDQVSDSLGWGHAQQSVELVTVEDSVVRYCVNLVRATRKLPQVLVGASPRGALALMLAARAVAVIRGRDYVSPEDVKTVLVPALAHRIVLRPETWMTQVSADDIVATLSDTIPAPAVAR